MSGVKSKRTLIHRVFDADLPCPDCGQDSVIGYLFLNEHGEHMHTYYVCTFWPSGKRADGGYEVRPRCGWGGWTVPGWDSSL